MIDPSEAGLPGEELPPAIPTPFEKLKKRKKVPTGASVQGHLRRELAARVLEMKLQGATYLDMSHELHVPVKLCSRLYAEETAKVKRRATEAAEDLVLLQAMRLERMLKALDEQVQSGSTRAAEITIKIMERQARLHGLDQPEKRQVEVRIADMPDDELLEHAKRAGVSVELIGHDAPLPGEASALPPAALQAEPIDVTPEPPALS